MGLKKTTIKNLERIFKEIGKSRRILDVGCGNSPYKPWLQTEEYIGIDVAESGRTDKQPSVWFDGINIPFDDEYFDFILCTEVLEHALEPESLMSEMMRVLTPSGYIFITVPSMWGLHEMPYDFRRYTTEGIKKLVTEYNLNIIFLEKEDVGLKSWIKLGLSENNNARRENGMLKYIFVKYTLSIIYLLYRVLKIKFPRIYLSNQIFTQK